MAGKVVQRTPITGINTVGTIRDRKRMQFGVGFGPFPGILRRVKNFFELQFTDWSRSTRITTLYLSTQLIPRLKHNSIHKKC